MPNQINASNLLVLKSRQLVWCPVFKAASTNWMKTIPTLSNYLPAQMQVSSPAQCRHLHLLMFELISVNEAEVAQPARVGAARRPPHVFQGEIHK